LKTSTFSSTDRFGLTSTPSKTNSFAVAVAGAILFAAAIERLGFKPAL
jgi:hypothetical protein